MADNDANIGTMVRGETPEGIEERCLQLCKDYLSGNWLQQTVDTIQFRRIMGFSNELYYCGIGEPSHTAGVPQEVAIKLYGKKWCNNLNSDGNDRITDMCSERLSDVVVALMVSESNLGPKVYGVFPEGQITHFCNVFIIAFSYS